MRSSIILFIFALILLSCSQQKQDVIIQKYFEAFNQSDFKQIKKYVDNDFVMSEGDFKICSSVNDLQTVFKWDSVFQPKYKVLKIVQTDDKVEIEVSKIDTRVAYLHDEPMISNVSFEFKKGKISKQIIKDYKYFDVKKWNGRLKDLRDWINLNKPDLAGFDRDITLNGAKNYQKAIDLYASRDLGLEENIFIDKDLQLVHLKDSVFVHISWSDSEQYGKFPSNGLIIAQDGKAIMVDTPMDNDKTEDLYQYLKDKMNIEVTLLIPGHFHNDCMGGITFLHSKGVNSIANLMTIQKSIELGLEAPKESFEKQRGIDFYGEPIECNYWGGGHSFDNITVWLPDRKILFGGCLIKNESSNSLGNLADAVVEEWDDTVEKIKSSYTDVDYIIPGHGMYGDSKLLDHTIALVQDFKLKH
ncbi:subclass B1 metallo-beta-lactamase [Plebeiibacterium sediminum]|uniref:beta-lactamase n=1 Tax=Plebeiibacterium sediminum TaxID=2992112 RepID=A0AAE3M2H0_9BACT|nr:subclass B1 metallo-beta-lactamase [Plebeiobacterium sediminum]MCW3785751.1 subclass B1 metallo-beta-lactamase [Plebeiobacterium sediminum]